MVNEVKKERLMYEIEQCALNEDFEKADELKKRLDEL